MSSCREVISLQLGNYANYIGSHWWNIQESSFVYNSDTPSEINHDVLFREGLTPKREVTYTPRLLLVDLKGSLGHMPERGELYEQPAIPSPDTVLWPQDKVELRATPRQEKNSYLQDVDQQNAMQQDGDLNTTLKVYQLEGVVQRWTDYLRPRFHPRTVTVVNSYDHEGKEQLFDVHHYGCELWATNQFQEEFTDHIRAFAEECDNMQGFHMLLDATDGFGGLGGGVLSHLQDEYPRKDVLAFPCLQGTQPDSSSVLQDVARTVNTALCMCELAEHASLFAPLCLGRDGWRRPGPPRTFQHVQYDASLPYHTGAILAAALDTVTLRYRLRTGPPSSLGELCGELGRLGRRAAAASVGLPFPMQPDAFLLDTLESWEGPLWTCVTPGCSLDDDRIWIQSVVLRGVAPNRLKNPEVPLQSSNPAHACSSVHDMLSLFLSCCCYATLSQVTAANSACRVTAPFPHFFSDHVQVDGSIADTKRSSDISVYSVPVVAGLHSSSSVGTMLETLHREAGRLAPGRLHQFRSAGLEDDELGEVLNQLLQLRDCYCTQFDV